MLWATYFKKKKFIHLAALGLRNSTWDLFSRPGVKPRPPALGEQSLNHWTTREVPCVTYFKWQGRGINVNNRIKSLTKAKKYTAIPCTCL